MKKNKTLLIIGVVLVVGVAVVLATRSNQNSAPQAQPAVADVAPRPVDTKPAVPAFQSADDAKKLGPTLEPGAFFGKAREAYQVARKIPATLAQLPCYCHCDKGFGHKSLHTCFEDDHASHCAVCVDEALMAYQLQTEEKLTPEQVRDRIITKYANGSHSHGM
jgi:hypothetical protein